MEEQQQRRRRREPELRHTLTPRQYARRRAPQHRQRLDPVNREVMGYALEMQTTPLPADENAAAPQLGDRRFQGQAHALFEHTLSVMEKSRAIGRRRSMTLHDGREVQSHVIYRQRVLVRSAGAEEEEARATSGADQLLAVARVDDVPEGVDMAQVVAEEVGRLAGQIVQRDDPRIQRLAMLLMHLRLILQGHATNAAPPPQEQDIIETELADLQFNIVDNTPDTLHGLSCCCTTSTHDDRRAGEQEEGESSADAGNCSVCTDELNHGPCTELPCKHLFHKKCITQWLHIRKTCPLCRFELPPTNNPNKANKRRRAQ